MYEVKFTKADKLIIKLSFMIVILMFVLSVNQAVNAWEGIPTYYEVNPDRFNPSTASAWTDWNVTSTHSIPKGAVVEMIGFNEAGALNWNHSIRENGGTLKPFWEITEAEAGGNSSIVWLIQLDSTGVCEYWTSRTTDCGFLPMGYWTGVNFTQLYDDVTPPTGYYDAWILEQVSAGYETIHYFTCGNGYTATSASFGVMEEHWDVNIVNDFSTHEAESGGYQVTYQIPCKVNETGWLRVYCYPNTPSLKVRSMGYFSDNLNFTGTWGMDKGLGYPTADSTWEDKDVSGKGDAREYIDGETISVLLGQREDRSENTLGVRDNGNTDNRYITIYESEDNLQTGYSIGVNTDSNGVMEFYSSDADLTYFWYLGSYYWIKPFTDPTVSKLWGAGFNDTVSSYISLFWDVTGNYTFFDIFHSTDGSSYSWLANSTVPAYNHTGLTDGSYHWYKVRGVMDYADTFFNSSDSDANLDRVWWEPASLNITINQLAGSWNETTPQWNTTITGSMTGDRGDLEAVDSNLININEVSGTPGFDVRFNVTIPDNVISLSVAMYGRYIGNPAHNVTFEYYDHLNDQWIIIGQMPSSASFSWFNLSMSNIPLAIIAPNNVIWGRIYHYTAGVATHDVYMDYMKVRWFEPSGLAGAGVIALFYPLGFIAVILGGVLVILSKRK